MNLVTAGLGLAVGKTMKIGYGTDWCHWFNSETFNVLDLDNMVPIMVAMDNRGCRRIHRTCV